RHSESPSASRQVVTADKAVKSVCAGTDYKQTCEDSLSKAVKNNATAEPKDILNAAFSVASDEIDKVIKQASNIKFDSPLKKAAFDDCLVLLNDAKEELNSSISSIEGKDLTKLSSKTGDLNNWLSAVLSYQQTCIDGFPEGKEKDALKKILKTTRELGSNALAITSQLSSIFSILQVSDVKRNLLSVNKDGFPSWISRENRRMLKKNSPKIRPNVTVAKDGSGDFTTVSAALNAMPEKYTGRYDLSGFFFSVSALFS
ncbi:putative pectinesterase/pectinesterase inhibitor 45, partial [Primulina huaijiensis]|uniref:putative pectinesterase/pectinesterase inhibitor 45 n=1 Tax=Primulina huaijiensis TaxID=1492673 RepID=UPI003CC70680